MRRRPVTVLLALLLAGCGAASPAVPHPAARPVRIMSINQCTDQLVLALVPPARIASVSWLARDPGGSVMVAAAHRVAVNHGEVEEVIAQAPDLIVGDTFSKPVLRAMLRRLGYPLVEVDQPTDLAAIRRATRQVAAAVGERARGEVLIAAMDAAFADLARHPGPPIRIAAWSRDGMVARPGSLLDSVIAAAGARNIANTLMPGGARSTGVETLLAADPALLVETTGGERSSPSLGDAVLRHPLVRRYWDGRVLPVSSSYVACGTPMIATAALRLRARLEAAGHVGPALPREAVQ